MKRKAFKRLGRIVSSILACAMASSLLTAMPAIAEESPKYPYVMFSADEQVGVTLNSAQLTINGITYTNGYFTTTAKYPNINGIVKYGDNYEDTKEDESAEKVFDVSSDMILIHEKLTNVYFTNNCILYDTDYSLADININTDNSIYVTGRLNLDGNIGLNNAVGAVSDVTLSGGSLNGNNTVIYSKFGDIDITSSQANINGLIYAPFGTVNIDSDNFGMNGIIIAQNIVITADNVNINYNESVARMVGVSSEKLSWTIEDWEYLADTDDDGLPNLIEKEYTNTDPYEPDTDGDKLPDGYELFTLGTDPTMADTDKNGISDGDEDFDGDGLSNFNEYELCTYPYNDDTDHDGISDGDEINNYFSSPLEKDTDNDDLEDGDELSFDTDPTNPDTDGNGILDGDEKREQTFTHKVKNKDCAIDEVSVSMEGTGNLQNTTTVESVMNRDIMCTEVVGLVGEPFEITTKSKFDKATITFKVDKSKLGDTEFDNLLFLWYDEENDEFVELDTICDEENSTVSIETTHFSKYMIVDSKKWFEAWVEAFEKYGEYQSEGIHTVICYDCSGSMSSNDPNYNIPVIVDGHTVANIRTNHRKEAITTYVNSMRTVGDVGVSLNNDKTALVSFESTATVNSILTDNKSQLIASINVYNGGGTNANAAINEAIKLLDNQISEHRLQNIILLTDGDLNISAQNMNIMNEKGIQLQIVGLGKGITSSSVSQYTKYDNVEYYAAATADELENIYSDLAADNQFDLSGLPDNDLDGMPDEFEISGMVCSNGETFYSNPYVYDSDGDTSPDGKEITYEIETATHYISSNMGDHTTYLTIKFTKHSDPTKMDTDNDGYNDHWDPRPNINDITVFSLSKDYIKVKESLTDWNNDSSTDKTISYGGSQNWFGILAEDEYAIDLNKYFEYESISSAGCGLLSCGDILLYLNHFYDFNDYMTYDWYQNKVYNFEDYIEYIYYLYKNWFTFDSYANIGYGYGYRSDINRYFKIKDIDLKANWGVDEDDILDCIIEMINNDIPVMLGIGPASAGNGVRFYFEDGKDMNLNKSLKIYDMDFYGEHNDDKSDRFINDHYVTVTGVQYNDVSGNYYLIISSWGRQYVISYDEYLKHKNNTFLSKHINDVTNILYIH